MSEYARVEEEETAVSDLQNKVSSGVGGGGSDRILRRSSQLFWPIEMECLEKSSKKF